MIFDDSLTPEARRLVREITPRIRTHLKEVNRVPVSVLVYGPGITSISPLAQVRSCLRKELRKKGHAAFFAEDLCDSDLPFSVRIQQIAQAQEFDLIVSLPCTPGSIAEVHDFAADRRVTAKMLVFLNGQHVSGYSAKSLEALSTILTCRIEYYPNDADLSPIYRVTFETVQRIREMKYILWGRYQI